MATLIQPKLNAPKLRRVCVFGAGSWGTILAHLACKKGGSSVSLYSHSAVEAQTLQSNRTNSRYLPDLKLHPDLVVSNDLKWCVENAETLIIAIPSTAVRKLCQDLSGFVRTDQLIIHGVKGFDPVSLQTMSEVIRHELGFVRVGALSGPNLAMEIAQGLPAAAVVASSFDEVCQAGVEILHQKAFQVQKNQNILGVEYLGALKNILALVAGLADEWAVGKNATAFALCSIQAEILKLIKQQITSHHLKLQDEVELLWGLAGFGDVFATATSLGSRNYRAGRLLARGHTVSEIQETLSQSVEGLWTLRAVMALITSPSNPPLENIKRGSDPTSASRYAQLESLASLIQIGEDGLESSDLVQAKANLITQLKLVRDKLFQL